MSNENSTLTHVKPLPSYLLQRYQGWRATDFSENKAWYRRLAEEGQRPRCMIITCCDSRVQVNSLFGAGPGEFFMHRNIANLVPPYEPDGLRHGTSAAIEYAVRYLKVSNLIVMGHSSCGGAKGCYDMCNGKNPDLDSKESFIGRWMEILMPGYERVKDKGDEETVTRELEKQTVVVSLENLMTFPFVRDAVSKDVLSIHGVWSNLASGEIEFYDAERDAFSVVSA